MNVGNFGEGQSKGPAAFGRKMLGPPEHSFRAGGSLDDVTVDGVSSDAVGRAPHQHFMNAQQPEVTGSGNAPSELTKALTGMQSTQAACVASVIENMPASRFIEVDREVYENLCRQFAKVEAERDQLLKRAISAEVDLAELQRKQRKQAAPTPPKREKPKSRPERWSAAASEAEDSLNELLSIQEEYQNWLDNLPENFQSSALAEKLQAVADIDIQSAVDAASEANSLDLPRGFGRD
jgi:hypothetical protein